MRRVILLVAGLTVAVPLGIANVYAEGCSKECGRGYEFWRGTREGCGGEGEHDHCHYVTCWKKKADCSDYSNDHCFSYLECQNDHEELE